MKNQVKIKLKLGLTVTTLEQSINLGASLHILTLFFTHFGIVYALVRCVCPESLLPFEHQVGKERDS